MGHMLSSSNHAIQGIEFAAWPGLGPGSRLSGGGVSPMGGLRAYPPTKGSTFLPKYEEMTLGTQKQMGTTK